MDKEILIKRLSIIKLLFKIGLDQSQLSELTSSFSILTFHDSVEMFLKLAAEIRGLPDCKHFIEYWDKIPDLTLKETMRNLNTRRVNLKHKGLIPGRIEIETSRVNTTDFFQQNTPLVFGLEFSDISLIDLIKFQKTKDFLLAAQLGLDNGNIETCVEEVTKSFYELLYTYKQNKKDWIDKTHFDLIEKVVFPKNNISIENRNKDEKVYEVLFEKVNKNFERLENAFEVIALGLNYRKYVKFKILTPISHRFSDGRYHLELFGEKNWTKENCQFLIDFVLESALKLQDFDFDFENLDVTKLVLEII
ncbi:MAG: hypothetical protein R2830_04455 [Saprospiraceae bacterium]